MGESEVMPETETATFVARTAQRGKTGRIVEATVTVDASDFLLVSRYKWSLLICKGRTGEFFYASASVNGINTFIHRLLLSPSSGVDVDHINGDSLDNRRQNLRFATHAQNMRNTGPKGGGFKGVSFHKSRMWWQAHITVSGKFKYLGVYPTAVEAAYAYDQAAKMHHGEFAWLNFPDASRIQNNRIPACDPSA